MPALVAMVGFVALLAIAGALVSAWIALRLAGRVTALERQSSRLADECRVLAQRIDAIAVAAAGAAPTATLAPESAPAAAAITVPAALGHDSGMNLNKRVQILRLSRRGESTAHIASVLSLPVAQVDLVLKLQRQAMEAPLAPVN